MKTSKTRGGSHTKLASHAEKGLSSLALAARERGVLELFAKGESYKGIAAELNISLNTVNNHLRNIRSKLRVHNSIAAINEAHLWSVGRSKRQP